eukprot:GHRR01034343.1.p1 GENE.GHRR01034343.1~~GHRR01034343.1.p1  ORF type:complete len:321 (+),score=109.61 GHRR01034343.1:395-1357(+)
MDSEDSVFMYSAAPNVIIIPTSSWDGPSNKQRRRCRACNSPVRGSPTRTVVIGGSSGKYEPGNFLTKGGCRAADKAAEQMLAKLNRAAIKDLEVANSKLASELVRLQEHGSEEKQALKEEVLRLEDILKGRLATAVKQNVEAEEKHHSKLKEVARRLKEEHMAQLRPLQDAQSQLMAELSAKQEESQQLEQARQHIKQLKSRLEMECASHAELWRRYGVLEGDWKAAQGKLGATNSSLREAEQQIDAASNAHPQLCAVKDALKSERARREQLQAKLSLQCTQTAAATVGIKVIWQSESCAKLVSDKLLHAALCLLVASMQ